MELEEAEERKGQIIKLHIGVFTSILIPLFLILIFISEKYHKQEFKRIALTKTNQSLMTGLFLTVIITILFFLPLLRETSLYFILPSFSIGVLMLILFLFPFYRKYRFAIILLIIFLHLNILYTWPSGIMITERSAAFAKLSLSGSWNPDWKLLNPYYNPFPMDIGLFSIVSEITSIIPISALLDWIIGVLFVIAFDLILYSLIKQISGSWRVGIFGVILFVFTPPARINAQP
ncbi:MAG: hypothetical protein NWE98_03925 [Candidatus Bathyarchaeota archaeon]|nr:hypothetical protein [Candidatus Bathyarchaeota archaeon]